MKTVPVIIGIIALSLSMAGCQHKSTKSESEDSAMNADSTYMMDQMAMGGAMKEAMDKMMKDMHQLQMTGNTDVDFAIMMKSHHEGAIDMAEVELESGTDETLKKMARNIVDNQSTEINELQSFIDSHKNPGKNYDPAEKSTGYGRHMADNMTMSMDMPKMDANASTDQQFSHMMMQHHQSGIHMAEGYIQFGKDQGLITMAKKIIEDQKKEVEELKKWNEVHK